MKNNQNKRIIAIILLAAIWVIPFYAFAEGAEPTIEKPNAIVNIPDSNLRSYLHGKTGILNSKPIRRIDLYNLTGVLDPKELKIGNAEGLQFCVNIEKLDLSSNRLSDLPDLSMLSKLHTLDLNQNNLKEVPPVVYSLQKLQNLNLNNNQLSLLPGGLLKLTALKTLSVAYNQLAGFPALLTGLKIKNLDISGNPIKALPDNISDMKELEVFIANECALDKLPSNIMNMAALKQLSLNSNQLATISKNIEKLYALEILSLSGNLLENIPEELNNLPKLKVLDFSNNRLSSLTFKNGMPLEELYLSSNAFSFLPKSIFELSKLKKLDVRFNRLTRLPEELSRLTYDYLNMEWNFINITEDTGKKLLEAIKAQQKFYQHQLAPVKGLEAVSKPDSIVLRWLPCTDGNDNVLSWKVQNYILYSVSGGETKQIANLEPTATEYTVSTLEPSKPYQFKVGVLYAIKDPANVLNESTSHFTLIDAKTADQPPVALQPTEKPEFAPQLTTVEPILPCPSEKIIEKVPEIPVWLIILLVCLGFIAIAAVILIFVLISQKRSSR